MVISFNIARDILLLRKIQRIHPYGTNFIFQYGMSFRIYNKTIPTVQETLAQKIKQSYASVESLLACAEWYVKQVKKQRVKKHKSARVVSVSLEESNAENPETDKTGSIYAGVSRTRKSWQLGFDIDGLSFTQGSKNQIHCANKYQFLCENVEVIRTELMMSKYKTVESKRAFIRSLLVGCDLNTLQNDVRLAQENHTRICADSCAKCDHYRVV